MRAMKVPVGIGTILGVVVGIGQLVAAAILYANGEHQAAGALLQSSTATNVVTLAGRFLQGHKAIPTTVQHIEGVLPSLEQELAAPPESAVVPDGAQPVTPPPGA